MKNKYYLMSDTVKRELFENEIPSKDYFYLIDTCPVCNSKKRRKLFSQWNINYFKCRKCGFVYSNPRLNGKGAFLWYNSDYYNAAMKTEHYLAEKKDKYISLSLNASHFSKFIEIFKKHKIDINASIADIGCGSGAIVHYIRDELGYKNVSGYDLNEENAKFAKEFRKIDIYRKDIYEMNGVKQFDVILTTENIEHVSDPANYLLKLQKLLKKNGLIFLTTPHNDSFYTSLMGLFGDHFCAPNHQNYFNFINLKKLLKSNSFTVIDFWIDNTSKFNLITFIKHFFYKRDQITALPPNKVEIQWIKKNEENYDNYINFGIYENENVKIMNSTVNKTIKENMKSFIKNLIPIRIKTHQIIVARNETK